MVIIRYPLLSKRKIPTLDSASIDLNEHAPVSVIWWMSYPPNGGER